MTNPAVALIVGGMVVGCMPLLYLAWGESARSAAVGQITSSSSNQSELAAKLQLASQYSARPDSSLRFEYQITAGLMIVAGVILAVVGSSWDRRADRGRLDG